jgi:type II restriction enzyme
VDLRLPLGGLEDYKSASQRARIGTESWGGKNLFCANCDSPRLTTLPHNTAAFDFRCPQCTAPFQLKSQSKPFGSKILDAAYSEMRRAILEDRTPNLLVLHYDLESWSIRNLLLIPRFAFSLAAVEKRKPLALTARRAGWVGCNILLDKIPADARIPIIRDAKFLPQKSVRDAYLKVRPLAKLSVEKRGWTLDVLNAIHSLKKKEFSLTEAYSLEPELSKLHPANNNVRPKIRQQLQVLRDLGLLHFLGNGSYRLG